jgi:hypothetical protein
MSVDKMSVDKMSVDKMSIDKMSVDKMSVDVMNVGEMSCCHFSSRGCTLSVTWAATQLQINPWMKIGIYNSYYDFLMTRIFIVTVRARYHKTFYQWLTQILE